jgi:hypothetical protein
MSEVPLQGVGFTASPFYVPEDEGPYARTPSTVEIISTLEALSPGGRSV